MASKCFWKIPTTYFEMTARLLVTLDIKKQLYSLFCYYELNFWFNFCECNAYNVWIQNLSLLINLWYQMPVDLVVLVSLCAMMSFEYLLKTWFLSWKCLKTNITSGFLMSFRQLFNLLLKLGFVFPTFCWLNKVHSIK